MDLKTIDLGGPVAYADHGGEGQALVLVHGLAGSHLNWMAVAPTLAEHFRVFAVDLVGFGSTPPAGRQSTLETNLGLLTRFVEAVAGPGSLVVGHSMGGLLTLQLAAARPDLVRAAVLLSAVSPGERGRAMDAGGESLLDSIIQGDLEQAAALAHQAVVSAQTPEQLVDGAFAFMHAGPVAPEIRAAHIELETRRGQNPTTTLAYLQAYKSMREREGSHDVFDAWVRGLQAPVLVLHGELDRLVPIANMRRAAALRPDWETVWLPHVGHNPQMEDPERFLEVVLPFLTRQAGGQLPQNAADASR